MARRTLGTVRQIETIARIKLDGGHAFVFVRGVGILVVQFCSLLFRIGLLVLVQLSLKSMGASSMTLVGTLLDP